MLFIIFLAEVKHQGAGFEDAFWCSASLVHESATCTYLTLLLQVVSDVVSSACSLKIMSKPYLGRQLTRNCLLGDYWTKKVATRTNLLLPAIRRHTAGLAQLSGFEQQFFRGNYYICTGPWLFRQNTKDKIFGDENQRSWSECETEADIEERTNGVVLGRQINWILLRGPPHNYLSSAEKESLYGVLSA